MKKATGKSKAMMPKDKMTGKGIPTSKGKDAMMPSYKKGGMVKKGGCK